MRLLCSSQRNRSVERRREDRHFRLQPRQQSEKNSCTIPVKHSAKKQKHPVCWQAHNDIKGSNHGVAVNGTCKSIATGRQSSCGDKKLVPDSVGGSTRTPAGERRVARQSVGIVGRVDHKVKPADPNKSKHISSSHCDQIRVKHTRQQRNRDCRAVCRNWRS